jgi:hypothetical protein
MKISPPDRFDRIVSGRPLSGLDVRFREDRTGAERRIWVAVDAADGAHLSDRQDVFLPALAFYAMIIREDLDCGGMAVDDFLLRNVTHAAEQYSRWFPRLRRPVLTRTAPAAPGVRGARTAAFCVTRSTAHRVDHAYHVLYSPQPEGSAEHGEAANRLSEVLARRDIGLVKVYSNIYTFSPAQIRNYAMVGHGAAFASLAHALSRNTGVTMLGSSHTHGFLTPYGSTPEVDPLFSAAAMSFLNDGAHFTRMDKVRFLSAQPDAFGMLNVCDRRRPQADYCNCSRCHKCLRTMTAIDVCGNAGDASPAFDWSNYSPEAFGRMQLRGKGVGDEQVFAEEIRSAALERRPDIAAAADRAIARSRLFRPLFYVEDMARKVPLGPGARQSLNAIKKQVLSLLGTAR